MVWFLAAQIFSTLISVIQIGRMAEKDNDLKIMFCILRVWQAELRLPLDLFQGWVHVVGLAFVHELPDAGDYVWPI